MYSDLVYFYDAHGITQHVGFAMTHGNIFSASNSLGEVGIKYVTQFPYSKVRLFRFI